MNAKYYPWSEGVNGNNTPGDYVRAWRHVVGIFRSAGATNVQFVCSPNISYSGTTPLAQLYPGDDWVDWTALDGYNGGSELPWGGLPSVLRRLRALFGRDPRHHDRQAGDDRGNGERRRGGSKPDWITRKFDELKKRPEVKAFVWFNHNKEADWRIQSSAASSQSFAAGVSDPRYAAATSSTTTTTGTTTTTTTVATTPSLSVNDVSVVEGPSGATSTAAFTVSLSAPAPGPVSVKAATANGSATAGSDYTALALTTVSFAAGERTKTVPVAVTGDSAADGNETLVLNLSAPVGAVLADTQGLATILNDD